MDSDIMTIKEVADYIKITEKTANRLVVAGDLPGFKVGGSWRFRAVRLTTGSTDNRQNPRGSASGDYRMSHQAVRA
ncbi:MAG: helix-turn-helix domain-containing protein [Albidovulum sp.]|nr:helix-turn-helix domain-containing protein [Albidovulum sp.]